MKIGILCGGISPERNVSLKGGLSVYKALTDLKHDVIVIDPALGADCVIDLESMDIPDVAPSREEIASMPAENLIKAVMSSVFDKIDLAFILLHGQNGEDGRIQSLLELRGIKYTGSGVKASALAIDKTTSKMLLIAAGINTPPWIEIDYKEKDNYEFLEEIRSRLGNRIVVKPNDQGSTIGITIVESGNLDDIRDAINKAFLYSGKVLAETFIHGKEITAAIIAGEAYPIVEIIPNEGFYDYKHKYVKGQTEYVCPAEIPDDISEFVQNLALNAYEIMGCSGFSRVDFRLDEDGQAFCLELNTIPGFTATSLVPMAAKAAGIEFGKLCEIIIKEANGDLHE